MLRQAAPRQPVNTTRTGAGYQWSRTRAGLGAGGRGRGGAGGRRRKFWRLGQRSRRGCDGGLDGRLLLRVPRAVRLARQGSLRSRLLPGLLTSSLNVSLSLRRGVTAEYAFPRSLYAGFASSCCFMYRRLFYRRVTYEASGAFDLWRSANIWCKRRLRRTCRERRGRKHLIPATLQ